MTKFATAMLIIALGVMLTSLIGLGSSYNARRNSIRVWIHPRTYQWAHGNPQNLSRLSFQPQRLNHGVFILGTSLMLPCLLSGTLLLIVLTADGRALSPAMNLISLGVMLTFFVFLPLMAIVAYIWISGLILATQPNECWQEEEPHA